MDTLYNVLTNFEINRYKSIIILISDILKIKRLVLQLCLKRTIIPLFLVDRLEKNNRKKKLWLKLRLNFTL